MLYCYDNRELRNCGKGNGSLKIMNLNGNFEIKGFSESQNRTQNTCVNQTLSPQGNQAKIEIIFMYLTFI